MVLERGPLTYEGDERAWDSLRQRRGHGIRIGPDIYIRVLTIRGDKVKLGIEAPLALRIVRDELGG